jgi:hypothetical protein
MEQKRLSKMQNFEKSFKYINDDTTRMEAFDRARVLWWGSTTKSPMYKKLVYSNIWKHSWTPNYIKTHKDKVTYLLSVFGLDAENMSQSKQLLVLRIHAELSKIFFQSTGFVDLMKKYHNYNQAKYYNSARSILKALTYTSAGKKKSDNLEVTLIREFLTLAFVSKFKSTFTILSRRYWLIRCMHYYEKTKTCKKVKSEQSLLKKYFNLPNIHLRKKIFDYL